MPSANKARALRNRAKRYEVVHNCAITAACERFLQSRGLPTSQRKNFNLWNATDERKTDNES
jgi:hypothetical protein